MNIKHLNKILEQILEKYNEFKNIPNGTVIGNFTLHNTTPHNGKYFITLCSNTFGYLEDVHGTGYITSGREGHNPNEIAISHGSGDKIDVVYQLSYDMDFGKWAKLAVPFLKHPKTAFVNFEGFSYNDYKEIKKRIIEWYPDLKDKINGLADQRANVSRTSKVLYDGLNEKGELKFMFCLSCKTAPHLDIGILPNSYSTDISNLPSV